MRLKSILIGWLASILVTSATAFAQPTPATPPAPKHPFTAKDWATLRSAGAAAVAPDGTILYSVTYGGEKGPNHH